jgi:hypothetical protein
VSTATIHLQNTPLIHSHHVFCVTQCLCCRYSREPGYEESGTAGERQMYADKIQFYCMERGVVDLTLWCLKRSLGAEHNPSEYDQGYTQFAPLIKANTWLFRHRLEARIVELEQRRSEGAPFVRVGFEHGDSDMGGLTGGCALALCCFKSSCCCRVLNTSLPPSPPPPSRTRRFAFSRLRSSIASMEQLFQDELTMWRQVPFTTSTKESLKP